MSLPWTKHCPENGQIHSTSQLFCPHCGASQDATAPPARVTVDLTSSSGPIASRTRPPHPNRIANLEREAVNHRLRAVQSRSNAGSSALSTRPPSGPLLRTTLQSQISFVLVLIKERFYFASKEDQDDQIQTTAERKFIGKYLFYFAI
jgi:hypothetical protein